MANVHLKGSNLLITGAGSGIGRAAAVAFAKRGATVVAITSMLRRVSLGLARRLTVRDARRMGYL